ncbi:MULTISPECIES: hypothetical protein [Paenibacillus]|uniref:hypothetical protein n=1 Tax=Paenibacillus TaxID=44249 RepID=UPI001F1B7AC4|nr:hypothetical protein [Paenibacillus sp. JJ-223]CAH1206696.1 hypothetical protein PAECIP111890_02814 [Paenibacillus sp. JJ-223]
MRTYSELLRCLMIVILCVFQGLCFPIPMQSESAVGVSVDATSNKEAALQITESQQKPLIRKYPQIMSKLLAVTHSRPVFLVVNLLLLLRIPAPRLPFKPLIYLFKRRLFLLPIKFTSLFVSSPSFAPKYANAL